MEGKTISIMEKAKKQEMADAVDVHVECRVMISGTVIGPAAYARGAVVRLTADQLKQLGDRVKAN
jgi:hypothetical protein